MKKFISSIKRKQNDKLEIFWYVLKFWVMMMAIFLYLLCADFSTAPEFIYNQF